MTPTYKVIRESYTCLSTWKKVIISVIYLFINIIIIIIIIIIIVIISDDPKTREARDARSFRFNLVPRVFSFSNMAATSYTMMPCAPLVLTVDHLRPFELLTLETAD